MRRRLLPVLLVVLVAALSAAAVAIAKGGSGDHRPQPRDRHAVRVAPPMRGPHGAGNALGRGIMGMVLDSLAGRLGVQPADLRKAVRELAKEQRAKAFEAAGLSQAEIDALKACRPAWHRRGAAAGPKAARKAARRAARKGKRAAVGAACDPAAARAAMDKLHAAAEKPDLAKLKADLAQGLATKLGKTPDEVLSAVRAELEQRLGQAVAIGFITEKGRDLALGCFDDPAACDLKALRAEVRFKGFGGKHRRPHGAPPAGMPAPAPMMP